MALTEVPVLGGGGGALTDGNAASSWLDSAGEGVHLTAVGSAEEGILGNLHWFDLVWFGLVRC